MGVKWKSRRRAGNPSVPFVSRNPQEAEDSLEELRALATGAGAVVVDALLQQRESPDSATLVGRGKLEELKGLAAGVGAALVVFDHDLTPTQLRNLESELDCRVIDRTQMILDIFARHARTREGQLQVELAQLNYLLPRLGGKGTELSRLGGGIGTRGPGEQKLEYDRRRIRRRIIHLEEALEHVRRQRSQQRNRRGTVPLATVALVGYTNAGKSTLFNRLTHAGVETSSRMFATLDPTLRGLRLPSRRSILLSDTVGFIRNLPAPLVKAFRATLEEVEEAALVLQVTDASSPAREEQDFHVERVLAELGAAGKPRLRVFNKADLLASEDRAAFPWRLEPGLAGAPSAGLATSGNAVAVSALTGEGIEDLIRLLDERLPGDPVQTAWFRFPQSDGQALSLLYEHARILDRGYSEGVVEVKAEVPESVLARLGRYRTEN